MDIDDGETCNVVTVGAAEASASVGKVSATIAVKSDVTNGVYFILCSVPYSGALPQANPGKKSVLIRCRGTPIMRRVFWKVSTIERGPEI